MVGLREALRPEHESSPTPGALRGRVRRACFEKPSHVPAQLRQFKSVQAPPGQPAPLKFCSP